MIRNYALCFLIILFTLNIFTFSKASSLAVNKFALSAQNTLSILIDGYFTENKGQWNKNLLFVAKTGFGHIALSRNCIYYNIIYVDSLDKKRTNALDRKILNYYSEAKENHSIEYNLVGYVIKVEFKEVRNISSIGMYPCKFKSNFFYGNNSKKWVTDVSSYREVIYPNIYEGIDLICYFESGEFFFEFVSYNNINFDSILSLISIEGIENTNFKLIKEHDKTRTSSKFYLTSIKLKHFDYALSIDVDSFSNAYACGWTSSPDFPTTPGTYDRNINGYTDCFILKMNSDGSNLIYSSFIGGEKEEVLSSIRVDNSGNAYACGWTSSPDFPTTPGAYDRNINGPDGDAFILKLDSSGSELIYSTFVGGENTDTLTSIDIDSSGNVYACGWTRSKNFPTTFDSVNRNYKGGNTEAVILKLNKDGSNLIFSTYIGGEGKDEAVSVSVDLFDCVYICGETSSPDFSTTQGAFNRSYNSKYADVFIVKLNSLGSELLYSTLIGGSIQNIPTSIAIDSDGNAYVCGITGSPNFPTTLNAYDTNYDDQLDSFLLKLNATGSDLVYSTFIGGIGIDRINSIDMDLNGNIYACGWTSSPDFPTTPGAYDRNINGPDGDAFILKLDSSGSELIYSTFVGGENGDQQAFSIRVDYSGNAYVCGITGSSDFPTTPGAYDSCFNGGLSDCFVLKIDPLGSNLIYSTFIGGS